MKSNLFYIPSQLIVDRTYIIKKLTSSLQKPMFVPVTLKKFKEGGSAIVVHRDGTVEEVMIFRIRERRDPE